MQIRRSTALPLVLAVGVLGVVVTASVANAIHARPKSAKPITAVLVPAYNQCTAANRTHGPPLAFPSCNPPGQSSSSITVGSPDANGAPANSTGSIKITLPISEQCVPGPPDDCDVKVAVSITDVRCKAGTAACGSANAAGGADYTGELQADATYRITDHFNAVLPGGGTDPATVSDISFPVNVPCAATASTAIGSTCSVDTLWNTVIPGSVKDGKRAIVEVGQIQITDGGPDGAVGTTANTLFGVQGIFIP